MVAKHFSEPFKDSNGYGESIARLSNMLGGGVIVQRFGDLIRGRRSTQSRIDEAFITPTLNATPGDLSLVLPKRILDGIIEMIYALDKVAPGTVYYFKHNDLYYKSFQPFGYLPTIASSDSLSKPFSTIPFMICE